MTNYRTYYIEESKFASNIETSMYSSHVISLWKRISLRLFLNLDFDIWYTSQDKHPPTFPGAKFKPLTFARILLERKMKKAVHIICTKRNVDSIVPPFWN